MKISEIQKLFGDPVVGDLSALITKGKVSNGRQTGDKKETNGRHVSYLVEDKQETNRGQMGDTSPINRRQTEDKIEDKREAKQEANRGQNRRQTGDKFRALDTLGGAQKIMADFILSSCHNSPDLVSSKIKMMDFEKLFFTNDYRTSGIKKTIKRLVDAGIIHRHQTEVGVNGFHRFKIDTETHAAYLKIRDEWETNRRQNRGQTGDRTGDKWETEQETYSSSNNLNKTTTTEIARAENLEIPDIGLSDIGWKDCHTRQLLNLGIPIEQIMTDANAFAWALKHNKVTAQNPINMFMGCMRSGGYNPPDGYKSPAEQAAELRLERVRAERERVEALKFEADCEEIRAWRYSMTEAEFAQKIPGTIRTPKGDPYKDRLFVAAMLEIMKKEKACASV